jgi:hypothetical protein
MSSVIGFVGMVEIWYGLRFKIRVFKGDCYIQFAILMNPILWFFLLGWSKLIYLTVNAETCIRLEENGVREYPTGCSTWCFYVGIGRFGLRDGGYSVGQARSPNLKGLVTWIISSYVEVGRTQCICTLHLYTYSCTLLVATDEECCVVWERLRLYRATGDCVLTHYGTDSHA